MLQLLLQIQNHTLLFEADLFSFPCSCELLGSLFVELPSEIIDLILLYENLFVEIGEFVLVELQLLEVLDLQLKLMQLALHGLLFPETGVSDR